jgi:hypothetical protein
VEHATLGVDPDVRDVPRTLHEHDARILGLGDLLILRVLPGMHDIAELTG